MRALIFSDLHSDLRALDTLLSIDADIYFSAGDLVSWARGFDKMGDRIRERLGPDRASSVYVIPGNHESASDIEVFCSRYGFVNVHGQTFELGGRQFAGLGYSSPTPFNTPGEYSEQELAAKLQPFAALSNLTLVCHCPPRGTVLDRVKDGVHAGSSAVREFLDAHQPEMFFCGHIHEAEGVETLIGRTRARNVGKKGYLLEWN